MFLGSQLVSFLLRKPVHPSSLLFFLLSPTVHQVNLLILVPQLVSAHTWDSIVSGCFDVYLIRAYQREVWLFAGRYQFITLIKL